MRPPRAAWAAYEETTLESVTAGGVTAIRTHFQGTTRDGIRVELEPLTVVHEGSIAGWDGAEPPVLGVIREYFRSSNAEDWDAFERIWTSDAELFAVGGPPRSGRADVVRAYRLFLGLFGRHEDRIERLLLNGRTATVLGTFHGSNPHGIEIEFGWTDVIEVDKAEHAVARLWHWHDRDLFRKLMTADA
jgi:ketosteroid isomerase-like protein